MPSGPARCSPLKPVLLITPDVQFLSVRLHARSSLHCKYFKMLRIFFPVFKELISGKHTVKCHVFFFKVWWKKKIKWWNGVRCVGFSFLFPCPPPLFPLFSSSLLLPSFVHFSLVHGDLPQHQFIHPHLTSLIVSEDVVSVIEGVFIKVSIRSSKGHTARKGFNFTEYKLISQLLVCLGNRWCFHWSIHTYFTY